MPVAVVEGPVEVDVVVVNVVAVVVAVVVAPVVVAVEVAAPDYVSFITPRYSGATRLRRHMCIP